MGVNAPILAAVAAATVGFAMEEHIPKGGTFTIGILSMIVAIAMEDMTLDAGSTLNVDGAMPKVQDNNAPPQTQKPIGFPPRIFLLILKIQPDSFFLFHEIQPGSFLSLQNDFFFYPHSEAVGIPAQAAAWNIF